MAVIDRVMAPSIETMDSIEFETDNLDGEPVEPFFQTMTVTTVLDLTEYVEVTGISEITGDTVFHTIPAGNYVDIVMS